MKKSILALLLIVLYAGNTYCQLTLFPNSIVSTNIDFIKTTDPDAFVSSTYIGRASKELPGASNSILIDPNAFVFEAVFTNNKKVGIWCHSSFNSVSAAQGYVDKLTPRLGKLPQYMRDQLDHVVIHTGNSTAFAEDVGKFFVLYSGNMDIRISNNDLEETVFHETVHVAYDIAHSSSSAWKQAQTSDVNFITDYAKNNPAKEDLAETALFVYTMCKYPGRLSTTIENWVNTNIPNRVTYIVNNLFAPCITSTNYLNTNNNSVVIYPNPTNGVLYFEGVPQSSGVLTISDIIGAVIYQVPINGQEKFIDISMLPSAFYLVKIEYENNNILVQKLISKE